MADLLSPATFGDLSLRNRLVMAPMTRSRADPDGGATELMVEYYRQRATAGLVVTEGIAPSEVGKGYCRTPVLDGPKSVAGWRAITDAVHAEGGTIVAQVMHCGRIAHADNKAPGADTVAPSAIRAAGQMYTDTAGMERRERERTPRKSASRSRPGGNARGAQRGRGRQGGNRGRSSGRRSRELSAYGPVPVRGSRSVRPQS